MSEYLLPCVCGRQTTVATAQAGQAITCACGARLDVPSMRGLRLLERPATSSASRVAGAAWSDRHRLAFLFVLAALIAVAAAGYLAAQLPHSIVAERDDDQAFEAAWKSATPGQVAEAFVELKTGLQAQAVPAGPDPATRRALQWGMGIALAIGIGALASAAAVLNTLRSERSRATRA